MTAWPPRWLTPVDDEALARGDGDDYATFIEAVCRITKDSVGGSAGELLILRDWQRELLRHLLARREDGRLRHRQALVGVARKNGKSALGAGIALAGLLLGPKGGEVYSCAGDRDQARIVFGTARRMVEMDPDLSGMLKSYRDAIEFPDTGSVYRVLSAEAYTKEGLNPHLVLFDEVHVQPNRELWDVMSLAAGARPEPLMVGVTTAGVRTDTTGRDSLCYGLYQYGQRVASGEVDDPSFFMAWWEPRDPSADHRDEDTWAEANPGLGDLVGLEDFQSTVRRTPENEYRTKRCNQWVSSAEAWLPAGAWDACSVTRDHLHNLGKTIVIPDGADVVLALDGSFSNDSTALIVATVEAEPLLDVAGLWEKPSEADPSWRVPIGEVEDAIRTACRRWSVREIAFDPFRWARTMQALTDERLPVVEFPQSPARMVPATQRFYEAVLNRTLRQSGDQAFARHVGNCMVKVDQRGSRLTKETKNSPRKIDLAVAAVMALDRAVQQAEEYEPGVWVF